MMVYDAFEMEYGMNCIGLPYGEHIEYSLEFSSCFSVQIEKQFY